MKKIIILFLSAAFLSACNNTTNQAEEKTETTEVEVTKDYNRYGDSITTDGAVPANQLYAMMEGKDSMEVKVEGVINNSCKVKGCWMKMDVGNDKEMHVTFKDYGFFVPTDLNGETAVIEGYATMDTLDVDYLRHLAEDGGKSEEEINAITEPEIAVTYVATGVAIKRS